MQSPQVSLAEPQAAPGARVGRLVSIDMLRGVAALGVVLYHAHAAARHPPGYLVPLWAVASYGFIGVWIFFVISGFCIHLRWAKAMAAGEPARVEFIRFWKKRIVRLYPAYLTAFLIYLAMEGSFGRLRAGPGFAYDVVMHLFLVHNLDRFTTYTLNGVFWTLAIEEQLYLAYFALLWMRGRWGWMRTLLVCLAARFLWFGLAWIFIRYFNTKIVLREAAAAHWIFWAAGALMVEAHFGIVKLPAWTRSPLLLLGLTVGMVAYMEVYRRTAFDGRAERWLWLGRDLWLGAFGFVLVNMAVTAERSFKSAAGWVRVLGAAGLFSYSLYLMHEVPLRLLSFHHGVVDGPVLELPNVWWAFLAVGLGIVCAWLLFVTIERPSMRVAQRL